MKLLRVELTNWCQHASTVVDFHEGLTALVGPIGSGKSNLVDAICWALTGVSCNSGVNADNVNLSKAANERSGVRLWFEHNNVQAEIHRSLEPPGHWLRIGQGEPVRKARDVNAALEEMLGVGMRMLLDYVFVRQWEVFRFLAEDEAEVAKSLGQLFGVERMEYLYRLLGEVRIPVTGCPLDGDALVLRLEQSRRELAELNRRLEEYADLPYPWRETETEEYQLLRQAEEAKRLTADQKVVAKEIAKLTEKLENWREQSVSHKQNLASLEEFLIEQRLEAQQVATELQAWQTFRRQEAERARLMKTLTELRKKLATLHKPQQPDDYMLPDSAAHQTLNNYFVEQRQLSKFLADWEKTGKEECSECGTHVETIRTRIPETRERLSRVQETVAWAKKVWDASEAYREELRSYDNRKLRFEAEIEINEANLQRYPQLQAPARDEPALQALLTQQKEFEDAHKTLLAASNEAQRVCAGLEGQLTTEQRRFQELDAALAGLTYHGEAAAQKLSERLAVLRERSAARDYARASKLLLERQINDDSDALAKYNLFRENEARAEHVRAHVEQVRAQFHRDSLPARVISGYLYDMKEEINAMLERFDAQFRLHSFDDWKFMVRLPSGRVHSARRLSGGQKVLFALAYRIVVNATFARELGLLCLDEPTAGLDEDSLACLDVALGRLRELSKCRGLQVILITHDRNVNLFDRVHRLAAVR